MIRAGSISDLKTLDPNDRFECTFLVQSKEVRAKKNGVPFISLRLGDRTGSIEAKVWDNVEQLAETFETNDFIQAQGRVQVYNNRHQAIITRLRAVPEQQVRLADFIPHTDRDIEAMYDEVLAAIDGLASQDLQRLMNAVFRDPEFATRYKRAPASRTTHRARIGGLLEHAVSMLRVARLLASHYGQADSDLLTCGTLLRNCGRVFELSAERSIEYTDRGRLLGHVSLGAAWLDRKCDEIDGFPPHLKAMLLHMVLSQCGQKDLDSLQDPLFPEAVILNSVADLDTTLEMMREAGRNVVPGSVWSPFHAGLGRSVLDRDSYLGGGQPPAPAPTARSPRAAPQASSRSETGSPPPRPEAQPEPGSSSTDRTGDSPRADPPASADEAPPAAEKQRGSADSVARQATRTGATQPRARSRSGKAGASEGKDHARSPSPRRPRSRPKPSPAPRRAVATSPINPPPSPPLPNQPPPEPAGGEPEE